MTETTDKRFIDSNQDKSRIIYRDNKILTTSDTSGSYVTGTVSLDLLQIKASARVVAEVYMKDNQQNRIYSLPMTTVNNANQYAMNCHWFMESVAVYNGTEFQNFQTISTTVSKLGGAISDTYEIYFVIYSTNINDNIIVGNNP